MSESQASRVAFAVSERYRDAYIVARTMNGLGSTIKGIGIVVGVILLLGALAAGAKGGSGILFAIVGLAIGGAIATVLYILGTLASAQGQILKATLDTAVNSSHFLSDDDRSRIMSLPFVPAPVALRVEDAPIVAPSDWMCLCGQRNPPGTPACLDCGMTKGRA